MEMLGIPLDLRLPLRKLITASLLEGHPDDRDVIFAEMEEMLHGIIAERMARPTEDIISRMIQSDPSASARRRSRRSPASSCSSRPPASTR
jgi:hypothetical protein